MPDDGRVSEDTKTLIRKLLITNSKERMTASNVKDALESIIAIWRSISAPTSILQLVPEQTAEDCKAKAEKEKAAKMESAHTDLLLKLMQQNHKPTSSKRPSTNTSSSNGSSSIKVTKLNADARPLTAEEYRMYGSLVNKLRHGESSKSSSTTGIPILDGATPETVSNEQLLLSTRSPLLLASIRRASVPSLAPPTRAEISSVVPVIEQESVLDLSLQR